MECIASGSAFSDGLESFLGESAGNAGLSGIFWHRVGTEDILVFWKMLTGVQGNYTSVHWTIKSSSVLTFASFGFCASDYQSLIENSQHKRKCFHVSINTDRSTAPYVMSHSRTYISRIPLQFFLKVKVISTVFLCVWYCIYLEEGTYVLGKDLKVINIAVDVMASS